MAMDQGRARACLAAGELGRLFIEELGWDRPGPDLTVTVAGEAWRLEAVADKCGFAVYRCAPRPGAELPLYPLRRRIDREVTKAKREHLIVFGDSAGGRQVWQWVKREAGKPAQCREFPQQTGAGADLLLQRLDAIAVALAEEEELGLPDVTQRVRAAFDLEPVTKRFYERFKDQRDAFARFLSGLPDEGLQRWYVSVMLNRLMFIYFVQQKGFLNGDRDYLRTKLAESAGEGPDRYYRDVLCPLFFEGFAKQPADRDPAVAARLGQVPYLNGGLFLRHQIEEQHGATIQIPDRAFAQLFAFFGEWRWHLDERLLRAQNEINPDVLGYIFEKYINQKQMGAYYTKEDITDYIGRNTIVPFLLDAAERRCGIAFEGDSAVWRLLAEDPDRYIYPAVRHGADLPLPDFIACGLESVPDRGRWNEPAPEAYALPTEIWREVVARRRRYEEVKARLAAGEVRAVNDLITFNLDLRQFAQDVVENCEGPDLLAAFWTALTGPFPDEQPGASRLPLSVLDPTCGSGAFLFAALNILEPLYEACLQRMQFFVDEWGEAGRRQHAGYAARFAEILKRVDAHPNHRYFVLKSIVVNNLFGVDLMDEAVEICKLRLFLKLVAQVDDAAQIEPLPDIDFNIQAGNTLVGFAREDEVERAVCGQGGQMPLFLTDEQEALLGRIHASAARTKEQMALYRRYQTEQGVPPATFAGAKEAVKVERQALNAELDRYLASAYDIDPTDDAAFDAWRTSHKPFHWFVEFFGIMEGGGFDVVIGNPPYVECASKHVRYNVIGFATLACGNLYATCSERALSLLQQAGWCSMIVPLSAFSTERMHPLVGVLAGQCSRRWFSFYGWRPAKLFDGVNLRLSIVVAAKGHAANSSACHATRFRKWSTGARGHLFDSVEYVRVPTDLAALDQVPKLGSSVEIELLRKLVRTRHRLTELVARTSDSPVYYKNTGVNHWITATAFAPMAYHNGAPSRSSRETTVCGNDRHAGAVIACVLNSGVFFWYYTVLSNCRDLNPTDIKSFPLPSAAKQDDPRWSQLSARLMRRLDETSCFIVRNQRQTGELRLQSFTPGNAKPIIDDIDRLLAEHYGFTDEELDFIINYDIKYRMGRDGGGEDEG